jgi:hypothetical protein
MTMTYEELTPYERTLINEVVIPHIRIGVGPIEYEPYLHNRVQEDCFKYNNVPVERLNCQQGANKIYDRIRLYLIDSGIAELRMGAITLKATTETHELRKAGSIERYNEIKENNQNTIIGDTYNFGDIKDSNLSFGKSKLTIKGESKKETISNKVSKYFGIAASVVTVLTFIGMSKLEKCNNFTNRVSNTDSAKNSNNNSPNVFKENKKIH